MKFYGIIVVVLLFFLLLLLLYTVQKHAGQGITFPETGVSVWNVLVVHTKLRLVKISVSGVQPGPQLTIRLLSVPFSARVSSIYSRNFRFHSTLIYRGPKMLGKSQRPVLHNAKFVTEAQILTDLEGKLNVYRYAWIHE